MSESEWLVCADPLPMLQFLVGKASERKLRLFAVAWCRRAWEFLEPAGCRRAVEISESYADGLASVPELQQARETAQRLEPTRRIRVFPWSKAAVRNFARMAVATLASHDAREAIQAADYSWVITRRRAEIDKLEHEQSVSKVELLRDIFGNPFRPVTAKRSWITWNAGTVVHLAHAIYTDRAFDRLPILADALEDAGCTNTDILAHCRGDGPHVRGCWVVDLLLAKE